ncbi:uncharacterized protein LOC135848386 [Planococcus citri]|uniref:uncharacterized protein LOC135848386 n=1 Tax=Planococcus citri TaxID=170843 RepID=UPI0031F9C2F8
MKCPTAYSMAVIYHKVEDYGRLLEFGYEVYYREWLTGFEDDFQWDHSNVDFGQAEEMNSKVKRIYKFFSRSYLPDMAMKFLWISKVKFKYNRSKWQLEWVWYSMELKLDQLHAPCENFNLGMRLYRLHKKQKLDDFYSTINQKEIFSKLQLPESVDGICKSEKKCVEEYDLVAPYRFQTSTSEPIECSKLTSIPIWYKSTKDLLDFTEKVLIALSQTVGNRIEVTTGAHDVLAFLEGNQKKPQMIPVYMNSKKKRLPVPKILYRTISSQNPDCDTKISECLYVVVIIIHNGPEISPEEKLCEDRCTEWGWDSVQYSSTIDKKEKSQFIYCCELDKSLREKLNYGSRTPAIGILDLKRYPDHRGKNGSPDRVNPDIQDDVENKIYELDQISPKLYSILGLLTG